MDWMIEFIDHLYTQIWTTGNYSAIADLHTLQFTVTHIHPPPSTALINSDASIHFSSSAPELISRQAGVSKLSWLVAVSSQSSPTANSLLSSQPRGGPAENTVSVIVPLLGVVAETCLPGSCLAMDVSSGSIIPTFRRHVTILIFGSSLMNNMCDIIKIWAVGKF
jgi:hypothetical protein